jgi:hypothetical protein
MTEAKTPIPMPHATFKNGYIAGWQSIRGNDPVPAFRHIMFPQGKRRIERGSSEGCGTH